MFNIKPAEFCPPMLNGVSASKVFLPKMTPAPHTVLAYLSDQFPHIEATEWQQRFHDGLVYDAVGISSIQIRHILKISMCFITVF